MKVTIIGTGYVGLVTGACFAETGATVYCIDIDKEKIDKLNNGIVPIYEPGLDDMIDRNRKKERLFFSTDLAEGLKDSEAAFICVGTPSDEDGSADLRYVLSVAHDIGRTMDHYLVVVTKSTVPIGTSEKVRSAVQEELDKRGANIDFDVASNPEFLKEGDAINDFMKPDRIVIGTDNKRAEDVLRRLYKPFLLNGHPILFMDIPSAEMTKYAANAMLATRISFMNELSRLCERVGADINWVRKGIGSDPRIGPKFLYAGVGYGGSCFPKDVKALIKTGEENGVDLKIVKSVEVVNQEQKRVLVDKVLRHYNNDVKGKTFTVWGLAFKPNTDDMREAPAITIINELLKLGASIKAYDPVATENAKKIFGDSIEYASDQYEALLDSDGLLLVTEWNEFRFINYKVAERLMRQKVIFDGRNIYDPAEVRSHGFVYYGIGRK